MRGLYIESAKVNEDGALVYFSPLGTQRNWLFIFITKMWAIRCIAILQSPRRMPGISHFDHNNYLDASPGLRQQVVNKDTTLGRNELFLQGLGGTRVKVRIPFLKDFVKHGPIAVNNALLILKNILKRYFPNASSKSYADED